LQPEAIPPSYAETGAVIPGGLLVLVPHKRSVSHLNWRIHNSCPAVVLTPRRKTHAKTAQLAILAAHPQGEAAAYSTDGFIQEYSEKLALY
jgi:hypothetical protein